MNSNILNLNILGKDNIVCVSLVNITMCINSIGKFNILYLSFTILIIIVVLFFGSRQEETPSNHKKKLT